MKGVIFFKLSMTKKGPQKFLRIEGDLFQNILSENIFFLNFCPSPNICDKLRRYIYIYITYACMSSCMFSCMYALMYAWTILFIYCQATSYSAF